MQNIKEQDDLDALFGEIETIESQTKCELSTELNKDTLEYLIMNQLGDTVTQSNSAVSAVLTELSMSPSDPAIISAAASFLSAHNKVIDSMNKLYILHEKHKHDKEMLLAKLMSDHKINQENNETKIMITREQAIQRRNGKVVDADGE
jgi:hypothetical protein